MKGVQCYELFGGIAYSLYFLAFRDNWDSEALECNAFVIIIFSFL